MNFKTSSLASLSSLITKGTTPTTLGYAHSDSGIPFLRVQNIFSGQVNFKEDTLFIDSNTHTALKRSQIQGGDVLVTIAGTIGRTGVVPHDAPEMNCNQAVAIVRPTQEIERNYLRHWLESQDARSQMLGSTVTGTISNLSLSQLGELRVPVTPLEEQRRIAAILDQAETLRTQRRTALALLDRLTQSLFLEMFGDPAINQKGWEVKTIEELCEVKGGKRLPKGAEYSPTPTPYRYIRVTNLSYGQVDQNQLLYLTPEVQKSIERYVVNTGDVIISIAGSIGLIAPVPASLDGANLTENAAKLVQRRAGDYLPDFLAFMLGTKAIQDQIQSHVGQVTIGKLALFRIEKLNVPLPPLPLQQTFATRIASIDALKATHRRALAALDALFASLQQRAFAGQL